MSGLSVPPKEEINDEVIRRSLRDFLSIELGRRSIEAVLADILLKPDELLERCFGKKEQ